MQDFLLHFWLSYKIYIIMILKGVICLCIGIYFAFFAKAKIKKLFLNKDEILGNFISQVCFVCILILSAITTLGTLGVQTTSIITLLGTVGIAIALGLKNSLSNLASGILLIVLRPFRKDDLIKIDKIEGKVEIINLFHTTLKLSNNKLAIIPNETITKSTIINHIKTQAKKIEWRVSFAENEPLEEIKLALYQAIDLTQEILQSHQKSIQLISIKEHRCILHLQAWIEESTDNLCVTDRLIANFKTSLKNPNTCSLDFDFYLFIKE